MRPLGTGPASLHRRNESEVTEGWIDLLIEEELEALVQPQIRSAG
jgi:hypothetical protein